MAFGPEGIAAWNNMLFNMDKNSAQRPYLKEMAQAQRDEAVLKSSGEDPSSQYKIAMANYLNNPNMALKGFTTPTKGLIEQGLVNAPGGLSNLVTPPNSYGGGSPMPMPGGGMPQGMQGMPVGDGGPSPGGGLAGPNTMAMPQQLPLTDQQINNLKKYASNQGNNRPGAMRLGMQNGRDMATNQEVTDQTGGNMSLNDVNNMYNRERVNKTIDKTLQKRIDYAQHLETTMNQIDPEVFKVYSGIEGKAKYAQDYALSLSGKAPPEFQKYQSLSKIIAPMFAGELRQFQGDSVREGVRDLFESLANPSTWQDPQVAATNYNMLRTILGSELKNDVNMAEQGPNFDKIRERAQEDIDNAPPKQQQVTKSFGGKTYVQVGGNWHLQ